MISSGDSIGARALRALFLTAVWLIGAPSLSAQDAAPLGGRSWGWQIGSSFDQWSFGCCTDSAGQAGVKTASEWTVPVMFAFPVGRHVTVDAYSALAHASVTLRASGSSDEQSLDFTGLTDTKLRASVRFGGDAFLATFGVNLPTGKTGLDAEELSVLNVIGAPALRFQAPAFGTGWGGTTGLVYTTRIGGWAWGVGASYEYRGEYAPAQAAALGLGTGDIDLRPGQAVRLSVGTDGLIGQSAMAVSLASTFYTEDRLTVPAVSGPVPNPVTLGPMFTLEWQLRAATPLFRELHVYAFDRYRTKYSRGGAKVDGTDGNEIELGARGRRPLTPTLSLVTGLRARHYSGLSIDNTLATAATVAGGVDVGLAWTAGRVVLSPTLGGEIGRLDTGGTTVSTHRLEAMFTITSR
jgi:hypothetical protein